MSNIVIRAGFVFMSVCAVSFALLPFGSQHGDRHIATNNSRYIGLPVEIYVNGQHYGTVEVHSSGYIGLQESGSHLRVFQPPEGRIAALEEVHGGSGFNPTDLYARMTNDTNIERVVASIVEKRFGDTFAPERTLIATWTNNECLPSSTNKKPEARLPTIQCVVTTDGYQSYALYFNNGDCVAGDAIGRIESPCTNSNCSRGLGGSHKDFQKSVDEIQKDPSAAVQLNPTASRLNADGDNSTQFFQLRSASGLCLTLASNRGCLKSCNDEDGHASSMTVFHLHGLPGSQQIELFGSGQCLDREHCHSSTSNLRFSSCDHCGAVHWTIERDGTMREDEMNNCIYVVSGETTASVHHSSDGCTRFHRHDLGDRMQLRSTQHDDCLAGSIFQNCGNAPQFMVYGLPGNYQIRDTASGYCLDREHCHSSSSNLRIYDCSHCGAIHWSMSDTQLGEDGMANCVNRGPANSAVLKHCSESWESMAFEVIQSNSKDTIADNINDTRIPHLDIPKPDVSWFIENLRIIKLEGLRLYRDQNDGTARFEVVHSLPLNMRFPFVTKGGVYQVQYWVSDITTSVPYNDTLVPGMVRDWLSSSREIITGVFLKYGAVDVTNREFGDIDGVLSLFVKNGDPGSVEIPTNYESLIRILTGLNGLEWWRKAPRFHFGTYNQTYYTFIGKSNVYQALYWPLLNGTIHQ